MVGKHIPPEIWAAAFLCLVESTPNGLPKLHPKEAPLLLTQICREWRDIALTTRSLWARLELPRSDDDRILPILHKYISLSQPLPLALSLDSISGAPMSKILEFMYVGVSCIHSERWKDVQFRLRHDTSVEALTSHIASKFRLSTTPDSSFSPILEAFELEVAPAAHDEAIFEITDEAAPHILFLEGLSSCQRLCALTIIEWIPLLTFPEKALPTTLHQISLKYSGEHPFEPEKFAGWMRNLPALSSLKVEIPGIGVNGWMTDNFLFVPPPPSTLDYTSPALRSLSVCANHHAAMNYVLSMLSAPNLQSLNLTITRDWTHPGSFFTTFCYMLGACATSLEYIELCGYETGLNDDIMETIAKGLPALKSLIIRDGQCVNEPVYTELFKFLTIDIPIDSDSCLLSVKTCQLQRIYFDAARLPPGPRFRSEHNGKLSPYDIEVFQEHFVAMADMILSRAVNLPEGATSIDGLKIQRLSVELGPMIMGIYRRCYPDWEKSTQDRWETVTGAAWEG